MGWWVCGKSREGIENGNFQCHLPVVQKEMNENKEGSNCSAVDTFLAAHCVRGGTNEDSRTTEKAK